MNNLCIIKEYFINIKMLMKYKNIYDNNEGVQLNFYKKCFSYIIYYISTLL